MASPLGIVALAAAALSLWTCAYNSVAGPKAVEPSTAAKAQTEARQQQRPASSPASPLQPSKARPAPHGYAYGDHGPRLLAPRPAEGQLGLPIAIQDRDGQSMQALHHALRRAALERGQARLLFYGASHVASDLFTGEIRRRLQARFGDAGRGFVLPVHPWRHYHRAGLKIESNRRRWQAHRVRVHTAEDDIYGLAGVFVESSKAGAFGRITARVQGDYAIHIGQLELFYLAQPGGGNFELRIDGRTVERVRTRAPVAGPAYLTRSLSDGPHSIEVRHQGRGNVRLFGMALERNRPGVIVDTLGINGSRARYQLHWQEAVWREHVARRRPDLVVIAYGTNEVGDDQPIRAYAAELRQVMTRVRRAVPDAACLLIGSSDRPVKVGRGQYEDRPRTRLVNQTQLRVALDFGCGFFDLVAFQGGPLSMTRWASAVPPMGAGDHVHFTRLGYKRLGQVLLAAMLEGFDGS